MNKSMNVGLNTPNSVPVEALKDGVVVHSFPSGAEAGRAGFCRSGISACLQGDRQTHKGFKWRSNKRKAWGE